MWPMDRNAFHFIIWKYIYSVDFMSCMILLISGLTSSFCILHVSTELIYWLETVYLSFYEQLDDVNIHSLTTQCLEYV